MTPSGFPHRRGGGELQAPKRVELPTSGVSAAIPVWATTKSTSTGTYELPHAVSEADGRYDSGRQANAR